MEGQEEPNRPVDHEVAATPQPEAAPTTTKQEASVTVPKKQRTERPKRRIRFFGLIFLLLVASSSGFAGGWLSGRHNGETTASNVQQQQVVLKTQGQVISQLAKDISPSVVSIESTANTTSNSYFGPQATEAVSAGTGIIISDTGLIVTNRHVVPSGTTKVKVILSDGTQFSNVEVVGRTNQNDSLDIAFLKIGDLQGKKLTVARIGDSSKMQVGDPVVAIGNALGQFENTITSGIISGHGRSLQASSEDGASVENLENLFQTDAAINQGNSGGPLINLDGEVIGINTAVATDSQNIGFAIPINDVKGLINSVISKGKLERPYIGVVYISITADLAKEYDLATESGAYIPKASEIDQEPIIKGGPADKAGVKSGDIITKVNDQVVDQNHSITSILSNHSVGDKVTLTINRSGQTKTISVTLGVAPTT